MSVFSIEVLTPPLVMEVYPLVRQIVPQLSLEGWRRYASGVLRDRSGKRGIVLLRRGGQRFPCGMCAFRLDQDLRQGRMLTAEHCVVMTSFGAREAFDALVQGVHDLAVDKGCAAVRWMLPADPGELPRNGVIWVPVERKQDVLF